MKFKNLILIVTLFSMTSCFCDSFLRSQLGSYRNYTDINGTIVDNRYFDPENRFSIKIPYLLKPGARIAGRFDKFGGSISFSDDMGKLIRVDVSTVIDIDNEEAKYLLKTENWKKLLNNGRHNLYIHYKTSVPTTKIIHQEYLTQNKMKCDFYIFQMNEGSSIGNAENKKRLDALRIFLSVRHNNSLIIISTQKTDMFPFGSMKKVTKEVLIEYKKEMLELFKTIEFLD